MTGNQLYDLICRFPQEVLPGGLRVQFSRIYWEPASQWSGEFWFSAPEALLPHLYMKLHLPQGKIVQLQNRAPGQCIVLEGQTRPKPNQELMKYLNLCARYIEEEFPDETVQRAVNNAWLDCFKLSNEMRIWWLNRPECTPIAAPIHTLPPRWLLEYWTANRIATQKNLAFETDKISDDEFALLKFGCECTAKICVPDQLIAGLPRFSYDAELGWIVEYLYFYRNEFKYCLSHDPQYRLKLRWPTGTLIEAENLSNIFRFEKQRGMRYLSDYNRYYLKQCRLLLAEESPTQTQIDELQGLWLINYSWIFNWLVDHKQVTEEMQRGALCPRWPQYRTFLLRIWVLEMLKGIRLGSPEVMEHCVQELTAATPFLHNEFDKIL